MTRARHLIVFAKAPRFGAVKTRLARDIGRGPAWMFYRRALMATLTRLGRDGRWQTWLAVAPDRFAKIAFRPRPPEGVRIVGQGRGDLGQRMIRAFARVFDRGPPGPAVLIGSDIPAIRPRHIAEAFRKLDAFGAVFGPAADGGYWLAGFRRRPPAAAFKGVRWSGPHALADTLANLANLGKFKIAPPLETLADVDDGPALAREKKRPTSGVP